MNVTAPKTVADRLLTQLVTLVQARKQARWQWKQCADEHKHAWTQVIRVLDARIVVGEGFLADTMNLVGFRMKREIVE